MKEEIELLNTNITFSKYYAHEIINKEQLNNDLNKIKTKFPTIEIPLFTKNEITSEDFNSTFSKFEFIQKWIKIRDCSDLLNSGLNLGTGTYDVFDSNLSPKRITCDMDTSGGGWTLVYHGYPVEANYNLKTNEVYSEKGFSFNQMRMQHVNINRQDYDYTKDGQLLKLKDFIPNYYNQVRAKSDTSNPSVQFHNQNDVLSLGLEYNRFMFGYGNEWRVFSSCLNVSSIGGLYMGGTYPSCTIGNYFNVNSIPSCTSVNRFYCSETMTSKVKDSIANITLKEFQEVKTWVRKITIQRTCKEYLDKGLSVGNDYYLIDPDGSGGELPYSTYCDMTSEGGGWTLVWSNTRGGTGKPTTNISDANSKTTRPLCSGNNNAQSDKTGNCTPIKQSPNRLINYYLGLNRWNQIGQNKAMDVMYSWSADSDVIHQSVKATLIPFSAPNYVLTMTDGIHTIGTTPSGFYTYHNGMKWSNYNVDNDIHSFFCGRLYAGTPWWYGACWNGSINGGGENSYDAYNGAYWAGSAKQWGNTSGFGAGNGWIFIRER